MRFSAIKLQGIAHQGVLQQLHRIEDHAALGALHAAHLGSLLGDRLVLVDDADPTLLGDGDGQFGTGHRVHGGRYDRHVQDDVARELGADVHVAGQHFAVGRDEQDIIVGEPFADELVHTCVAVGGLGGDRYRCNSR